MSFEQRDKGVHSFTPTPPAPADAPEIYQLMERGASVQELYMQLTRDFYSGAPDKEEKIFLAVKGLKERAMDGGVVALQLLSQSGDAMGELVGRLLDVDSDVEMEKELGMERKPNIVTMKNFGDLEPYKVIYERAKERGLVGNDITCFEEFYNSFCTYCTMIRQSPDNIPHITGDLENEIMALSSTFGTSEPGYLELMGPKDVLEFRGIDKPMSLLLGSMGKYSAREFACFLRKLNPSSAAAVIDSHPKSSDMIEPFQGENGLYFRPGNALDIPIKDKTLDRVFTNFLINSLVPIGENDVRPSRESVEQLLTEVYRVLKPGGSLILLERGYANKKKPLESSQSLSSEIKSIALQLGFNIKAEAFNSPAMAMRSEVLDPSDISSGVDISSNGFPHYEDNLLLQGVGFDVGMRLMK